MGSDFFHKNFLSAHHSEVISPKFRSLRIRQEPLDEARKLEQCPSVSVNVFCKKCFLSVNLEILKLCEVGPHRKIGPGIRCCKKLF